MTRRNEHENVWNCLTYNICVYEHICKVVFRDDIVNFIIIL